MLRSDILQEQSAESTVIAHEGDRVLANSDRNGGENVSYYRLHPQLPGNVHVQLGEDRHSGA